MQKDGRYAHIDAMRALAVMLVVVGHAGLSDVVPGGSGVTIFFGISGFIITHLLLKEHDRTGAFDIRAFYGRRALKIMPPLLAVIIGPTLALFFLKGIEWKPLLGIVFFYYNWLRVEGIYPQLPGSEVVWSLSIEEQFYLVFALIWFAAVALRVRLRRVALGVLVAALLSLGLRIALVSSYLPRAVDEDRIYYASDTRIDAIAFGVLTAISFYYSSGRSTNSLSVAALVRFCERDAALVLAFLSFMASLAIRNEWFRYTFRFSVQALAACVVIIYGFGNSASPIRRAFNSISKAKIIQLIGLSSYSIYLVHMIAMVYAHSLIGHVPPVMKTPALIILGTTAGIVVYLLVEKPIQRRRHKIATESGQRS